MLIILELDNKNKLKKKTENKATVVKVKQQAMNQDKILANHISDKGLICRICKEYLKEFLKFF